MAEYLFTNLPQYVKLNSRSEFSSSVVSSGAVLLFTEDGYTLTGKLPDGTFITIGGSGGTDVSSTTAEAGDVLAGKIFYTSGGVKTSGSIPTVSATSAGSQITVPSGYIQTSQTFNVSGGVDVSDTTAQAPDVRSGAIFYDADGIRTTGTIPSMGAFYITPSTSDYEIPDGVYIDGGIIVKGDSNLVGSNILSGVSIFGVPGELIASGGAEVTLGYITSGGQFQPLAFSGTSAADSGSPVTLSCYSWNLPTFTSGVIVSSGMSLYVSAPLNYISTTINNGGRMYVLSGGTATNTILEAGGNLRVSSGGTAIGGTGSGVIDVSEGGSAYGFNMDAGGLWVRYSPDTYVSGTLRGSTVLLSGTSIQQMTFPAGLAIDMESGTYAENVTLASDTQIQFNSGASGAGIVAGGNAIVRAAYGGAAYGVVVYSGAELNVDDGGTANNVSTYSGGNFIIFDSGSITSARILAGGSGLVSGYTGNLSDAVVSSGGSLILSKGTATDITVSSGGTLTIYSTAVTSNITSAPGAVIINS